MRSSSREHAVRHDGVQLAREIQRMTVREMPAVRQIHAQHGVARLQQREVHRHVRLGARVRLDVGVLGAEKRLRPIDRERFGDVDELAAAVVALARIPFGVFVGQDGTGGFEDRRLTKFSDAISSRPSFCRCCSLRTACAISGSASARLNERVDASVFNVMISQSPRFDRGVF